MSSQVSTLTPYLQLPHRLSLTWLAYPILSLLFVAFRLQLSLSSAQDSVASAKSNLLASCQAAERAATAASSMPRYLAIASNNQFADAVNGTINAARATLVLALTIMEVVINFIIDIYRSTFLCFLELVVRGGLAILIGAVNELNSLVQSVSAALKTSIQSDIQSANSIISKAIGAINKINPLGNIAVPQIPIPNLDSLNNITLPDSFTQSLTNLNNSIPTVAQLKNEIESIIDTPFELLKKDINDTFNAISFNSSILPIPQQNTLTFCQDMDLSVVDDVGADLIKIAKIGVVILILIALLLVGLNCLLEWWKWRCLKRHLEYTRQAWTSDPTMVHAKSSAAPSVTLTDHNLMMLNANSEHPLITRILNNMSRMFRLSPRQHTHTQWFCHYIFHPPALACLLIGVIGLLSIQIQLAAMGPLVAKYKERSADTTADFSATIFSAINGSMYNQSAAYADDINGRVDVIQTTINEGVFGWVNVTTTTLNNTIVAFYNDVQNAVGTVFDGTILESPAQEFIRCILGTKVDAIEKALTFLHDNLVVNMPRVNQTVLVLSQDSVNEVTQPIAEAAVGGGPDGNEGLILRIVNAYAERLKKERLMFFIFLGLWGIVVLMGLGVVFWHSYGKEMVEARKRRRWEREQRAGINGLVVPFRTYPSSVDEKRSADMAVANNLPALTPLPSPKGSERVAPKTDAGAMAQSQDHAESGWAATFKQRFIAPPVKLMAIGRKNPPKEDLVEPASTEATDKDSSENNNNGNKRNTAWFRRMTLMLEKDKQPERPKLQIIVDDYTPSNSEARPTSRWSSSPVQPVAPWKNRMMPKSPPSVPPKPSQEQQQREPLLPPVLPTPFAPPIHLGFDDSRYPRIQPFPSKSRSQDTLLPPPRHHTRNRSRTSSVPVPTDVSESITPITRLLTTLNARQSVDPFVTPFDDEYRVTIAHPTHTRKSIPTNPFLGPGPVAL
ncbi:hypothetical protein H0H81_003302 [Sphagnurus paluster]|uniref:Plasma membrane fusion protein PRM1 n=1 Tax=Sphagnurus paluster TaxID=117069 RepID=A0A9P7GTW6_9AGAR|nr:hypothetical protein H0H81_003302 [Sphagnurus paluster]